MVATQEEVQELIYKKNTLIHKLQLEVSDLQSLKELFPTKRELENISITSKQFENLVGENI